MRLVIQRVSRADLSIEGITYSTIEKGLLLFLGIEENDTEEDAIWLANKVAGMRIFTDSEGKMNLGINEVCGEILVVSQFTLHASTKKGNRPSFILAARPEKAIPLYEGFIKILLPLVGKRLKTGKFGADMKIMLVNDGPVTIVMDSKNKE